MDIILDPTIDEELDNFKKTILSFSKKKYGKSAELFIPQILGDILTFEGESFFKHAKYLLHIALYNYIYSIEFGDDFLKELDYEAIVEEKSPDELLQLIIEDSIPVYELIGNYLDILYEEGLLETIQSSTHYCKNLKQYEKWEVSYERSIDLVTNKLKKVAFRLDTYCRSDSTLWDEIIISFFYKNDDVFDIVKTEFSSMEEFLAYRFLLIQLIIFDSYLYFTNSEKNEELAKQIKELIEKSNATTLPNDTALFAEMFNAFIIVNVDKEDFLNNYPEGLEEFKKRVREKTNILVASEYY